MKAYLLKGMGDIVCAEVEDLSCGGDDVIVEVKAAGICGSDIPRIYGAGSYSYP